MPMPMPNMSNMSMSMDMQMQMTFYSDAHFEFLFDSWHVDTKGKYVGALFGLFFFAISLSLINFVQSKIEKSRLR
jgi:hypothetical protein